MDKLEIYKETIINKSLMKEQEIQNKLLKLEQNKTVDIFKKLNNIKVLVVNGDTGSGKSCFCFKLLQELSNAKQIFVYNHPRKDIISILGYKNMYDISEIQRLNNCVIYIDEPQLSFSKQDKKTNEIFLQICSLARQRDITLVFSTSDTRYINKGLESYVSHWIIKNIDLNLVKQGSIIKKIVKTIMPLTFDSINLEVNEFLLYSNQQKELNGQYTFIKPIYYNDSISKAYNVKTSLNNAPQSANKITNMFKEVN